MPGIQRAIAYYDTYEGNYPVDDRLVGGYIDQYRDRLITFAERCGLTNIDHPTTAVPITPAPKAVSAASPIQPLINQITAAETPIADKQAQLKVAAAILLALL